MNPAVFKSFPELSTSRLELKEVTENDLERLIEFAISDPEIEDRRQACISIIERTSKMFKNREALNWGLYIDNVLLGTCGYYRGFSDDTGEIGYVMHPDSRRKGYMKEAALEIIRFGFEDLGLKRIVAYTDPGNEISINLLKTLNFTHCATDKDDSTMLELYPD